MTQPDHLVKTTAAMRLLLGVKAHPCRTTEWLKTNLGNTTQTFAARLCDLMDLGLVQHGPIGVIVRGNHTSEANTFMLTPMGAKLMLNPNRDAMLKKGFKALNEASEERARALAESKEYWKSRVATEAQSAMQEALLREDCDAEDLI